VTDGNLLKQTRRIASFTLLGAAAPALGFELVEVGSTDTTNTIEIRSVGAGEFNPDYWTSKSLHWVGDRQSPLLEPLEGKFRNIYAPSVVEMPGGGWRVFYGAWDGIDVGQDHIYFTTTRDFRTFGPRHQIVRPGPFEHVCNVNAIGAADGGTSMVCTVYPDQHRLNKPAIFSLSEQELSAASPTAITAGPHNIVNLTGYERYPGADINGMNVLLRDAGKTMLYFGSFTDFGKTYRASSSDGVNFVLDGVAAEARLMVNDVKKFQSAAGPVYLMGFHRNRTDLRYSISADGLQFGEPQVLFEHAGDFDRHIVALGWVVQGAQEAPGRKLLGVLYGAGAVPTLDRNRIYARWLQKKLRFANTQIVSISAAGPDAQILTCPSTGPLDDELTLLAEDGITTLGKSRVKIQPGKIYEIQ